MQSEGTFGGTTYAVDQGENDSALYYNKNMFRKAGLPVPWKPTNWNDIISRGEEDQGIGARRHSSMAERRLGFRGQRPTAGSQQLHRRLLDAARSRDGKQVGR